MTPKERFKGICAFERVSDPFIWNIDSWYESFERWVREGMPVKNLDNKKERVLRAINLKSVDKIPISYRGLKNVKK